MKKLLFSTISLLTILVASSCGFCSRSTVNWHQLADELNKIYACNRTHIGCTSNIILSEYETIIIEPELFSIADDATNYNPVEQDDLIDQAEQLALDNQPNCESGDVKLVYDIQFINDILVCTGCTSPYTTYIQVTYACCSGRLPS